MPEKLSDLTELAATPASGDQLYIQDVSEATPANQSKRITYANLIPEAGTPVETVLSDTTLSSDGTFDISSISGAYTHLKLYLHLRSDYATGSPVEDGFLLTLNNDTTGSNYLYSGHYAGSAGHGAEGGNNRKVGFIPANSSPANHFANYQVLIPLYAGGHFKNVISWGNSSESASVNFVCQFSYNWFSTSAVTRVTVAPQNGANFKSGSRLTIIGVAI